MRAELDDSLCRRYPVLFSERHAPAEVSAMYWGFACGDGWFNLIDCLCAAIEMGIRIGDMPPVSVIQVKEKLGTLRFRFRGGNEMTRGMVRVVEMLSAMVDEGSGQWCLDAGQEKYEQIPN